MARMGWGDPAGAKLIYPAAKKRKVLCRISLGERLSQKRPADAETFFEQPSHVRGR